MSQVKPTFGATLNPESENKPIDDRSEIGAIWERTSKNNFEFLTIQLKLSVGKLKELLQTTEEEVAVNLVAFPNRHKEGVASRPSYRIFEEKKR